MIDCGKNMDKKADGESEIVMIEKEDVVKFF